jgi:hypothetical protein
MGTDRHLITLLGYPIGTASDEVIDSERIGAVLEEVARNGVRWLGHDWKPPAKGKA